VQILLAPYQHAASDPDGAIGATYASARSTSAPPASALDEVRQRKLERLACGRRAIYVCLLRRRYGRLAPGHPGSQGWQRTQHQHDYQTGPALRRSL